jgi:CHAT domain-containing protein
LLTYIYSASTSHDRDKAPGSGKRTNECRENPERVEKYQALLHELADLSDPKTRTKDTLRSISAMFAGDSTNLILSENFTEQKVKDYPLQDYRIIFFATHGLLPGRLRASPNPHL